VALILGIAAAMFTITRLTSSWPQRSPTTSVSLPTKSASYLGVYEKGPPDSYEPVTVFTKVVGRQPNLIGYYSGWGEPFKVSFAKTVSMHGAATIVQMDPTLVSVSAIASGKYDNYLRTFARSIQTFHHSVVIGFGHEMNANWYSWGYGHTPSVVFVAAWKHIVTLFRSLGTKNVSWLWTVQADEPGTGPITSWWPGANYVTWVGIDGYYYRPYEKFDTIFGKTIAQVRTFTDKPVLLSETAVGPVAGQSAKISDLFAGMEHYGTLGLVWFDIAQDDGLYHQDWHIEDSMAAERAFRREASALTLARP
jgi:Glycosyl hydrolase family 26